MRSRYLQSNLRMCSNYGYNMSPGANFHFYLSIVKPYLLTRVTSCLLSKAQSRGRVGNAKLPFIEPRPSLCNTIKLPLSIISYKLGCGHFVQISVIKEQKIAPPAFSFTLCDVERKCLFLTRAGFIAGYQAIVKQNKIKTLPPGPAHTCLKILEGRITV